jgi:alpha-beta hydrolase superfamily lysophospholipase
MPSLLFFVLAMFAGVAGCAGSSATHPPASGRAASHGIQGNPPQQTATNQPMRRTVALPDVRLSILEGGSGDPIIYVHGVVTTSNIFTNYLTAYSPAYRGIAVDLRGYGDSDKTATGSNIDQFVADLIALADRLGIEKPVWVGVSMGGMILQRLALSIRTECGRSCWSPRPTAR